MIDYSISVGTLLHATLLIVTIVGVYWKLRELIFTLHNANRQDIGDLKEAVSVMKSKVDSIWEWFVSRLER